MCRDFENLLMLRKYIGQFLLMGVSRLFSLSAEGITQTQTYLKSDLPSRGSFLIRFVKKNTVIEGFPNPIFVTSVLFFNDQMG